MARGAYEVIYKLKKRKVQDQELGAKWASGMVIDNIVKQLL